MHENYLSFSSDERFDLILLISCDFGALSPAQRTQLLRIFAGHLSEHGTILLDVWSMAAFSERHEDAQWEHHVGNGFWAPEDHFVFINSYLYPAERVVLDKFTVSTEERDFTIYNWNQFYDKEALAQEFASSGLAIKGWYANVTGATYDEDVQTIAIVARKSST